MKDSLNKVDDLEYFETAPNTIKLLTKEQAKLRNL